MKNLVLAISLVIASSFNVFSQYTYATSDLPYGLIEKYNLNYLDVYDRVAFFTNDNKMISVFNPKKLSVVKINFETFVKLDNGNHDIIPDTTKNLGTMYEYLSNITETFGVWEIKEKYSLLASSGLFNNQITQIFHYDINDSDIEYIQIFETFSSINKLYKTITLIMYNGGNLKEFGVLDSEELN